MDFTAINLQEAILSLRGLVLQAGILDNIEVFLQLAAIFVAVGFATIIIRVGLNEKTFLHLVAYVIVIACLWSVVKARADVGLNLFLPPEQEKVAQASGETSQFQHKLKVNWIFAYTVGLVNRFEQVATSLIGKALSPDSVARNSSSIIESIAEALAVNPADVAAEYPKAFEDLQKDINMLLRTTPKEGCGWVVEQGFMVGDPREVQKAKERGLNPILGMMERAVLPDAGRFQEDYALYEKTVGWFDQVFNKDGRYKNLVKKCLVLPDKIQKGLYQTFAKYVEESGEMERLKKNAGVLALGRAMGGDDGLDAPEDNVARGVFYGFAKRTLIRAEIIQNSYRYSGIAGKVLARAKEAFGILSGTSKMLEVINFMPYLRGVTRTVLYTIFPFFMIIAFLPSGLRWLGTYYKFIFAVSLWSVLDTIIVGISDEVFWNMLIQTVARAHGVDFSLNAMVWAQGVAMTASPLTSYALVQLAGSGAFGVGTATPPSFGLVGKVVKTISFLVR